MPHLFKLHHDGMQTCFGWTALFLFRLLLISELVFCTLDLIQYSAALRCILSSASSIRFMISGSFQSLAVFRIAFWLHFGEAGLSVNNAVGGTVVVVVTSAIILLNVWLGNKTNTFRNGNDELAPACGILQGWWGAWHAVKIIWVGTAMLCTVVESRKRRCDDKALVNEPMV